MFSTVVEILGKKPKHLRGIAITDSEKVGTVTQDARARFFDSAKPGRLLLEFRVSSKRPVFPHIGQHEGKAYVSAEHAAPQEGPRVQSPNGNEEWPYCAEAPPGQGTKASDCR